jgi:hypothetical protein
LWLIEPVEEPMYRRFAILVLIATTTGTLSSHSAQAFNLGYSRGVTAGLESIHRMAFRGAKVAPADQGSSRLMTISTPVGE